MRLLVVTRALFAAFAMVACGGGTPPPSDESAAHGESKAADPSPAADTTTGSAAASASAEPAPSPSPATSTTDSSGPPGDDPWMASHQMTPKDVLRGVRPAQAKAQACFHAGVKRDPSTSGEVKIRFIITNDGVVRVWRDDGSSMSDGEVTTCVGELIKSLKFPKQKSPGDAYGTYSVNFTP